MDNDHRRLRTIGVVFAALFPTLVTWAYFVLASRCATGVQQSVYLVAKIIQFSFPAVWTWFALREALRTARPTVRGQLLGIAFGVAVSAAGVTVFYLFLRDASVFASAGELVNGKIKAFGINTAAKYFVLAGFYSVFHSLLEEYYWRWFVFRQMRRLVAAWPAIIGSGLAFTLHHIVVLNVYFNGVPWLIVTLSAGVAVGGWFWAWLYERSNSMFDTWPSHLLIDAGLFFGVGYELVRHGLAAG